MDVSILIPWRPDGGQRDRVFEYLLPLWEQTGAQVCVGEDDPTGPFNCARAQNRAFRLAKHDKLVMFGADQLPELTVLTQACDRLDNEPWFPLFNRTAYYSKDSSARIMSGKPCQDEPFEEQYPYCEGVLALTRTAYHRTGGMDERFSGWGAEDSAFRHTLYKLYGDPAPFEATLRCLWHSGEHRVLGPQNRALVDAYNACTNVSEIEQHLAQRGSFL